MKRYFVEFTSDRVVCQSNTHLYGFANTVKTAKGYIRKIKKEYAADNLRSFKVYDTQGDAPENEHVPFVYSEE